MTKDFLVEKLKEGDGVWDAGDGFVFTQDQGKANETIHLAWNDPSKRIERTCQAFLLSTAENMDWYINTSMDLSEINDLIYFYKVVSMKVDFPININSVQIVEKIDPIEEKAVSDNAEKEPKEKTIDITVNEVKLGGMVDAYEKILFGTNISITK